MKQHRFLVHVEHAAFTQIVLATIAAFDQFPDFDPRKHYAPTIDEHEMTKAERAAAGAADVDDVELSP